LKRHIKDNATQDKKNTSKKEVPKHDVRINDINRIINQLTSLEKNVKGFYGAISSSEKESFLTSSLKSCLGNNSVDFFGYNFL